MLNLVKVNAVTLPDLWFQAISQLLEHGRKEVIDRGSYEGQTRLEFDYFTGHVTKPWIKPLIPEMPAHLNIPAPVEEAYIYGGEGYDRSYIEYIMTDRKEPGESYTYGERLTHFTLSKDIMEFRDTKANNILYTDNDRGVYWDGFAPFVNQIDYIIETYKKHGHRNNQLVLQVAKPDDILLMDPPCLRSIDTRVQDNQLHFFVYFRSWDLWGGLPANLAGIQELKSFMASEIGVDDGEMVVESKGLHIYGYAEDLAKIRCMKEESD